MFVLSSGYEIVIPFLLVALIFVVWWAHRLAYGAPFEPILLGVLTAVYVALFVLLETNDWLGFAGDLPVALVVFALAVLAFGLNALRTTQVLVGTHGGLGYRGSRLVAMIWFLVLLLEIYAQLAILGYLQLGSFVIVNGFPGLPIISGGTIPHSYAVVLAITDGLFALSTGATVGQNLGIYTAVLRFRLRERSTRSTDAEFRSS